MKPSEHTGLPRPGPVAPELRVRVIEHGSRAYDETVALRDALLRRPLGLAYTPAQLAAEADQLHLAAYLHGEAVACAVLQWLAPGMAKMRQVAVKEALQGRGLGRCLVAAVEGVARNHGVRDIVLHARSSAVPFYSRLGYEIVGDPFEEIGLPHRRMFKRIVLAAAAD